ncbi:hypothetical protein [Pseudotamlana agarivorans]|uniref:hypothetical protein n=1 Tax=Pseudotamlana agarivorans TaxID=481183 RepID=UPI0008350E8A|nr:hypothetical protein [Tamlana agarivorans]
MEIDKTEALLQKFHYKFERKHDKLIVESDFSFRVIADFSNPNKIILSDRLFGWNFLTGLVEMSLKNAMIYNFIGGLILVLFYIYMPTVFNHLTTKILCIGIFFWILIWTVYYLIKAESIKRTLTNWNK